MTTFWATAPQFHSWISVLSISGEFEIWREEDRLSSYWCLFFLGFVSPPKPPPANRSKDALYCVFWPGPFWPFSGRPGNIYSSPSLSGTRVVRSQHAMRNPRWRRTAMHADGREVARPATLASTCQLSMEKTWKGQCACKFWSKLSAGKVISAQRDNIFHIDFVPAVTRSLIIRSGRKRLCTKKTGMN